MANAYHRNVAGSTQPNDQRYYDQALSAYPALNDPNWVAGAYTADGSLVEFGGACTARVVDTYSTPTCCSMWAGVPREPQQPLYCPLNCNPAAASIPPVYFPLTVDQEMAIIMRNCQ